MIAARSTDHRIRFEDQEIILVNLGPRPVAATEVAIQRLALRIDRRSRDYRPRAAKALWLHGHRVWHPDDLRFPHAMGLAKGFGGTGEPILLGQGSYVESVMLPAALTAEG